MAATPDDSTSPTIEVRDHQLGDQHRLVELYETCFGGPRALDDWRWRYEEAPLPGSGHVLTVDGRVMAFVGRSWFDAWVERRRARLGRGGDLMVDPEIRGAGLTRRLLDAQRLALPDVICGFPRRANLPAREMDGRTASTGDLPQWVRWQTGSAVHADATWIPSVIGVIAAAALRVPSAVLARAGRRRAVVDVDLTSFDQWACAFDDLAFASREFATAVVIRDARHLRWRWLDRPGPGWHIAVVPRSDTSGIDGFIVYGMREGQGRVVDILATDASAMQSLVLAAIDGLSGDGVERILFELADPRPWSARVLRRCGFLRRGRSTQMRIAPLAPWMSDRVRDLRMWYVTFGDTDHD